MVRSINDASHLHFQGLQVYHGKAQHIMEYRDRRDAINVSLEHVVKTVSLLEESGMSCPIISGAGTGSYPFETASGIYTELQCGSYIFMDGDYGSIQAEQGPLLDRFENSLFVVTSVMSTPTPGRIVCDAGLKAHSIDSGLPTIRNNSPLSYQQPSDEHGIIVDPTESLVLGDKLWLIPGHCDPTVNLHDWYVGVRNSQVECLWPVSARGMIL
jgi:3-hydroxy-D-aspartate aldolase